MIEIKMSFPVHDPMPGGPATYDFIVCEVDIVRKAIPYIDHALDHFKRQRDEITLFVGSLECTYDEIWHARPVVITGKIYAEVPPGSEKTHVFLEKDGVLYRHKHEFGSAGFAKFYIDSLDTLGFTQSFEWNPHEN